MTVNPPVPSHAAQTVPLVLVVNHMLEPPGRVTGITRFLFAMLQGLLKTSTAKIVLVTTWQAADLPAHLVSARIEVVTVPYQPKLAVNVMRQGSVLTRLMRKHASAIEFNANPVGYFSGDWPRVITVHDLYLKLMPEAYPLRHRLTWNVLFPLSARNADSIVVPSQSTRQDLGRFHPGALSKTVVISEAPAFDLGSAITGPPVAGRYGLIVGNVSPNKNVGVIIEALARLEAQGVSIPIVHIGRDETGALAAAQKRTPLKMPILTMPGVSDGQLRGAYTHAVFFLNTSLHEGFCLPVVEAQSCGTPVIASNRSALPEVAGEGALLIDPASPQAIAQAMKTLWLDPEAAQRASELGTANVARFSWDRAAMHLLIAMQNLEGVSGTAMHMKGG